MNEDARSLQVRCPHCHNPIQLVDESPLSNIECPSCGSHFSLIGSKSTAAYQSEEVKTIGHFELVEQVGVGQFGSVWKARDSQLDRIVAIKVPRKGRLDGAEAEQFLREARAAAQVRHSNIVSVHEVGREDDTIYIVSDFIQGANLSEWLSGQRLSPREAAELCAKLADALHEAHEAGVTHRDLKPGNIMLTVDGEPCITDFGLAKRDTGEISMTMDGRVMGTPAYMSPEQARGEAHQADRRSDIYSLGIILYELLTGELPFRGETRMLIVQVLRDEPPSPRKLNSRVPRDLETICLKCLEKEPAKRYGTMAELADELRRYLAGEAIHARPISGAARAWRWCKRKPAIAGLAVGFLVAVLGGLLGVSSQWLRAEKEVARSSRLLDERETALCEVMEAKEIISQEAESKRRQLYVADMNVAAQAIDDANLVRAAGLLQRHAPTQDQDDLRSFEWFYLWRACDWGFSRPKIRHGSVLVSTAISTDGTVLATGGTDQKIKLWDIASGELLVTLSGHSHEVTSVCFSENDQFLASSGGGTIRVWPSDGRKPEPIVEFAHREVRSIAFSPDSQTLVSGGGDGRVVMWSVPAGEPIWESPALPDFVWGVAYSSDGNYVASAGWDGAARVWNATDGNECLTLKGHKGWVMSVAFSPDNRTLASSGKDRTVRLWDLATGDTKATLVGHDSLVLCLAFSKTGQELVSGSQDNAAILWDLATGEIERELVGHSSQVSTVAFSPDNKMIVTGSDDGCARLWAQKPELVPNVLTGHSDNILALTFDPTGQYLASRCFQGHVKLWDVASGKEVASFDGESGWERAIVLGPDREIVTLCSHEPKVWNADVSRLVARKTSEANALHLASDGILRGLRFNGNTLEMWDLSNDRMISSTDASLVDIQFASFSRDGQIVATCTPDHSLHIWRPRIGQVTRSLGGHTDRIEALAFSLDGTTLASGGLDGAVKLWTVSTGELVAKLVGQGGRVLALCFTPDGKTLASAGADRTIKLWDTSSFSQKATLRGHADWVKIIQFSPQGNVLASASNDGTIRLWRAATKEDVESSDWLTELDDEN